MRETISLMTNIILFLLSTIDLQNTQLAYDWCKPATAKQLIVLQI